MSKIGHQMSPQSHQMGRNDEPVNSAVNSVDQNDSIFPSVRSMLTYKHLTSSASIFQVCCRKRQIQACMSSLSCRRTNVTYVNTRDETALRRIFATKASTLKTVPFKEKTLAIYGCIVLTLQVWLNHIIYCCFYKFINVYHHLWTRRRFEAAAMTTNEDFEIEKLCRFSLQ